MKYPGDLKGDSDPIIQLCPEGPEGKLMERLIRMTWVSTSPLFWRYDDEKSKMLLVPPIRANLDALENMPQPKEITIWFLNPWGLDATNLQGLVESFPGGGLRNGS